jgi:hypothetical protein
MKRPPEERVDLAPEEREFVARVAAGFRPAPLAAPERAAFDAALAERIARRRARGRWLGPGWIPAALAAALAGVWLATGGPPAPPDAPQPRGALFPAQAWEEEVLLLDASFDSEAEADLQVLPEEYLAIANVMR